MDYTIPINKVLKFKYRKKLTDMITDKFDGYSKPKYKSLFHRRKVRALYGSRVTLNFQKHPKLNKLNTSLISKTTSTEFNLDNTFV